MNGYELGQGKGKLIVEYYQIQPKRTEILSNNLYVKPLPKETTEVELKAIFEKYGQIGSVMIPTDPVTGATKGFGYVCFKNVADAQRAVQEQNGVEGLYVTYHKSKELRRKELLGERVKEQKIFGGQKLFVRGVDLSLGEEILKTFFESYGPLMEFSVDQTRRQATVKFNKREDAARCLDEHAWKTSIGYLSSVLPFEIKEQRQLRREELLDKKQYEQMKLLENQPNPVPPQQNYLIPLLTQVANVLGNNSGILNQMP